MLLLLAPLFFICFILFLISCFETSCNNCLQTKCDLRVLSITHSQSVRVLSYTNACPQTIPTSLFQPPLLICLICLNVCVCLSSYPSWIFRAKFFSAANIRDLLAMYCFFCCCHFATAMLVVVGCWFFTSCWLLVLFFLMLQSLWHFLGCNRVPSVCWLHCCQRIFTFSNFCMIWQ